MGELVQIGSKQIKLKIRIASAALADSGDQLDTAADIRELLEDFTSHAHRLELGPLSRPAREGAPETAQLRQTAIDRRNGHVAFALANAPGSIPDGDESICNDLLAFN